MFRLVIRWKAVPTAELNRAARSLLDENTAALEAKGAATVVKILE